MIVPTEHVGWRGYIVNINEISALFSVDLCKRKTVCEHLPTYGKTDLGEHCAETCLNGFISPASYKTSPC